MSKGHEEKVGRYGRTEEKRYPRKRRKNEIGGAETFVQRDYTQSRTEREGERIRVRGCPAYNFMKSSSFSCPGPAAAKGARSEHTRNGSGANSGFVACRQRQKQL